MARSPPACRPRPPTEAPIGGAGCSWAFAYPGGLATIPHWAVVLHRAVSAKPMGARSVGATRRHAPPVGARLCVRVARAAPFVARRWGVGLSSLSADIGRGASQGGHVWAWVSDCCPGVHGCWSLTMWSGRASWTRTSRVADMPPDMCSSHVGGSSRVCRRTGVCRWIASAPPSPSTFWVVRPAHMPTTRRAVAADLLHVIVFVIAFFSRRRRNLSASKAHPTEVTSAACSGWSPTGRQADCLLCFRVPI